jgi:hypothetical protein
LAAEKETAHDFLKHYCLVNAFLEHAYRIISIGERSPLAEELLWEIGNYNTPKVVSISRVIECAKTVANVRCPGAAAFGAVSFLLFSSVPEGTWMRPSFFCQ